MPKVPTRSIVLLACAGFASQAMVRVTDSLLPQIAADFGTSVGEASIVVAAYAITARFSSLSDRSATGSANIGWSR